MGCTSLEPDRAYLLCAMQEGRLVYTCCYSQQESWSPYAQSNTCIGPCIGQDSYSYALLRCFLSVGCAASQPSPNQLCLYTHPSMQPSMQYTVEPCSPAYMYIPRSYVTTSSISWHNEYQQHMYYT